MALDLSPNPSRSNSSVLGPDLKNSSSANIKWGNATWIFRLCVTLATAQMTIPEDDETNFPSSRGRDPHVFPFSIMAAFLPSNSKLDRGAELRASGEMEQQGNRRAAALTIDGEETPETRMWTTIRANPVVVLSRRSCCMCHVMKKLLETVGAYATVIELDEAENVAEGILSPATAVLPALFIGGAAIGGLEVLVTLHLSGRLVPRLQEVGALCEANL
ncbi:hypothetical protein HPP92_019582 [Vanilla planifolia]|uniref:Glutaredoxin domain-containing protein n=1 Tax=Vanilla planifolia TaxID=51239 RepID=A0A835Q617_VANPL|nr:hypothetical protein HPP92_019582 [Vanilla planifolia]